MRESASVGAHLINDVRAFSKPGALKAAANIQLPICLMHMSDMPTSMKKAPHYENIVLEITTFLKEKVLECQNAGIKKNKILLDPGFGFGKSLSHNYHLLSRLSSFHHLGLPLLVGMSRKSMIGKVLNTSTGQRVSGSVACAVIAALQGVKIIRAHDVKQTAQAIRIVEATLLEKETYFQ
ncbi:dihydropteroate synthase [secondary endosymbiont of Heteropsylla cubana]|uniref:dihydropteroate synthase n=1 Tax=secondary endosymbiont of Heteropsylla cubana TaxID=134287 RepID=J7GTK7_9ENTR|nr:dihydropteroate synthase [secondary endosymbiont of Heteropsylla cubana]